MTVRNICTICRVDLNAFFIQGHAYATSTIISLNSLWLSHY